MSYKNSFSYVQRQTNKMLRQYKKFVKIYINDIIVYSRTLSKHLIHLRKIFELFRRKRVNLIFKSFFLSYFFVVLLDQKIDSLDMTIIEKKIATITLLRFSTNLKNLKTFLKFTKWLRSFISRYAQRVNFFQKRKINLTRQLLVAIKKLTRKRQALKIDFYEFIYDELKTFKNLKNVFREFIFLTHYDKKRKLFINLNASKSWNFVDMIYHINDDSINDDFSRIKIQFIIFFNKYLNDVEKNYWFIELKIIEIIWIIRKIRHLIEFNECSSIIVYIDYFVVVLISRQISLITFNIDKLNLRLVRVSQYLSNFNLIVKYKFDKFNIILDAFSRFQNNTNVSINEKIDILKALYNVFIEFCHENLITITSSLSKQSIYYITLIKIINEFKQKLKHAYQKNSHWKKILDLIKSTNQVNFENNVSIVDVLIIDVLTFVVTSIIVIATIIFATSTNLSKRVETITIVDDNDETTSNRFDLRFNVIRKR